MSTAWIVAFAALAGVVGLVVLTVLGLTRRIIPILERLEAQAADLPDFGVTAGSVIEPFDLYNRDGDQVEWRRFMRAPTIMVLVAAGCEPCRELPSKLDDVGEDVDGAPLLVVASEPPDELAGELERHWRVLYERDESATRALQNQATPQAYFVDPSGLVLGRTIPRSRNDLAAMVDSGERRMTAIG